MTKNQIEYMKLQEDIRSHMAQEKEAGRSNRAREVENERANRAQEELTRYRDEVTLGLRSDELREQQRANLERERLNQLGYEESKRTNLAREEETNRSNLAKEAEIYRANMAAEELRQLELEERIRTNKANEEIGRLQASAAQTSASAALKNAETRISELASLDAYRAAQLQQDERRYAEVARHNLEMEEYNDYQLYLRSQELANTERDIANREAQTRISGQRLLVDQRYAGLNYNLDVANYEERVRGNNLDFWESTISSAVRLLQ